MTARTADRGKAADFVRLDRGGAAPPARKVVLVPGAEVPVLTLDLPAALRGPAREQVARRQLRDRLGLDDRAVEMRPFHAPGATETWTRVLVADAARLAEWRGLVCRAVLPDYLSLPVCDGVWTLRGEAGGAGESVTVLARLGLEDGFSAPSAPALAMLARALDEATPKAVLMLGEEVPGVVALIEGRGVPVARTPADLARRGLPEPGVLQHGETAFDLRRDPQAARARLRRRVLPWRWPLLFAALAAGLWAGAEAVAIRDSRARAAALSAAAQDLARAHFVPEGPILDIRVQVARALDAARASGAGGAPALSPLDLFGAAADVVAGRPGVTVDLASYGAAEGLLLVLRLPDFAAADQVAAALRGAGLAVELRDARVVETGAGVRGEFRISEAGQEAGR